MFYYDELYSFHRHCIGTQYKFVLFPKRCFITSKLLWLTYAYKQTAMYTGPGDPPAFETRWADRTEFIKFCLMEKYNGIMER
jgi:hypothetical protein